ncbi:transglycosylase domain-containing protein [Asaccharospora irregularis]|uniref:Penicillin-binding protein 1A n=1 Tax=Asaccharospora irregularis DSM 2635 TaxID=1121321 RepID=A0A1M5JAL3_9FIRM|nr:transglycosylase domain-containing protein [Asaccharospora irregularis]SHG37587.1 penicillin-binding protein 1A [Asaccharospora irregularis DSM 2635]
MSYDNNDRNKIRRKKVSSSTSKSSSTSSKTQNKKKSKSKSKKDKFRYFRSAGVIFLILLVVGSAGFCGLVFASLRDVEPVTEALLNEKTHQTTTINYATGDKLSNAPSINKKTPVPLDKISKDLQNAVISIEDERFYEHNGVDIKGLLRSVVKTLTGTKQGGSTVPMQVSKMLLTTEQQTLPRKIKDIYYAYEMSKNVSKEKILETYLNNFFVGKGLAGAEAGARGYFDKSASDLTLSEAALLAGSTKNPSKFSAYTTAKLDGSETKEQLENKLLFFTNTTDDSLDDPTEVDFNMIDKINSWGLISDRDIYKQLKDGTLVVRKAINNPKAKERQEVVLKKMLELGHINDQEYSKAMTDEINIKLPKSAEKVSSSVEDYIESEVIDALIEQGHTVDEARNMFYNGGLIINTTIDPKMQDALETEYENNDNFPGHTIGADGISQPQSSMVILDYKNGNIKALVGGRNIKGRKTLNRAITPKQPGSTIKPLSVYTPAIDTLKITQADAVSDVRGGYKFKDNIRWNPKTTTPGKGTMSLRKALAKSSNTIAAKTAEMLGGTYDECVDVMIDYLKNFGITTLNNSPGANTDRNFSALTLGGMAEGVSPLQMAVAYGTLANQGTYVEPSIFTTITTYDGQLIVKNTPEEHKVVDPEVAYVLTDMLCSVVTEGTGGAASLPNGMPVAGKTGTTNNSKDAWFVGYTPYYVGATYLGDDAGTKDANGNNVARRKVKGGSGSTARLWAKVMAKVHQNLTVTKFPIPKNVYFTKINLIDGGRSPSGSKAAFIKGTYPGRISSYRDVEETDKPEETEQNNDPSQPNNNENPNPGQPTNPNPTQPNPGGGSESPAPPPVDNNNPGGGNSGGNNGGSTPPPAPNEPEGGNNP